MVLIIVTITLKCFWLVESDNHFSRGCINILLVFVIHHVFYVLQQTVVIVVLKKIHSKNISRQKFSVSWNYVFNTFTFGAGLTDRLILRSRLNLRNPFVWKNQRFPAVSGRRTTSNRLIPMGLMLFALLDNSWYLKTCII